MNISQRQKGILSKLISLSDKYNIPVSHTELLTDEDGDHIGVLWNYPHVLMDIGIYDEDEVVFALTEKLKKDIRTKIAAFDCVENSEKLFESIGIKGGLSDEH